MTESTELIAQRYIQLALAIEEHIPGYVDAYHGPQKWKIEAETVGLRPVAELAKETSWLAESIANHTEMDAQRRDFLTRQIGAMQTSLRLLQEEKLSLAEETKGLYDISPEWVDETIFEEAHQILDDLLPPGDSLVERMEARKKATELSIEQAESVLHEISKELRQRTQKRFPLPPNESFELQLVSNQPWGGYNWYLGNFHSRIDINTDLPLHITRLTKLMAHEGYPGHHTELSLKEKHLVGEKNYVEHSIALINSPSCVISEGIATRALSTLMTDEEQIEWHAELFAQVGFDHLNARREHEITKASQKLSGVYGNTAFLLHDQETDEDEVAAYIQTYGLSSDQEVAKRIEFLSQPFQRSYIFTYHYGGELLDALFVKQDDRDYWFRRLLTEPVTPSQIQAWAGD